MAKTVFILGAGASKAGGAPLMAEFLDVAQDIWAAKMVNEHDAPHFARVFEAIGALQITSSKARIDLVNIESVFNTFEMARLLGRFPPTASGMTPEDAIESLSRVIAATLERTSGFTYGDERRIVAPQPYPRFVELLKHLRTAAAPRQSVAVLSFNYDLGLDYALSRSGLNYDYCLADTRGVGQLPFLKLHGSLNWAIADNDEGLVVPWPIDRYCNLLDLSYLGPGPIHLSPRQSFNRMGPDGATYKATPFIVAPTWNKTEGHRAIKAVWERAARELAEAENIFVIGYSLPETDGFFRNLYALGTIGSSPLRRFWLIDPDTSGQVEGRFRGLLGSGAESRFRHLARTFASGIGEIEVQFPRES